MPKAMFVLTDPCESEKRGPPLEVVVQQRGCGILEIRPAGYGEPEAEAGCGAPVFLDYYGGVLRVVVAPDILDEAGDFRQMISLEGAREERRDEVAQEQA